MKIHFIIWVYILLFLSCSSRETRKEATEKSRDSSEALISHDSSVIPPMDNFSNNEQIIENTQVFEGSPKITQLPIIAHFGYGDYEMSNLVRKSSKVYRLPPIHKVLYIHTDTSKGYECHSLRLEPTLSFDSLFNFKTYRYKLPNIYRYQSYLVCDTLFSVYNKRNKDIHTRCHAFVFKIYCYLLLYDSLDKSAKVIALQYMDYPGERRRIFDIDKNFKIHLYDYTISSDDTVGVEIPALIPKYDVKILPKGEIEVKSPLCKIYDYYSKKVESQIPPTTTRYLLNGKIIKTYE
ncbi:MAG: hypothetical protein Q8M15_16785 [Bacteroidota bacterium]|nr:hypothetical protein [Bacteroidota bacterium]